MTSGAVDDGLYNDGPPLVPPVHLWARLFFVEETRHPHGGDQYDNADNAKLAELGTTQEAYNG